MALDGEHPRSITRQAAAGGVVKHATERCLQRRIATAAASRSGRLQPEPLAGLKVDAEDAQRRLGYERTRDRHERACRHDPLAVGGGRSSTPFQKPRLLGVSRQRYPIASHQQRLGCLDHGIAGGITAGLQPVACVRATERVTCCHERIEPGVRRGRHGGGCCARRPSGLARQGDLSASNPRHAATTGPRRLEHLTCSAAITGTGQRGGPHHRERRPPVLGVGCLGQPSEPRRRSPTVSRLKRRDRCDHGGSLTSRRREPAAGDRHHPGRVIVLECLGQRPFGPGSKQETVGIVSSHGQRRDHPRRFGSNAPPGATGVFSL